MVEPIIYAHPIWCWFYEKYVKNFGQFMHLNIVVFLKIPHFNECFSESVDKSVSSFLTCELI